MHRPLARRLDYQTRRRRVGLPRPPAKKKIPKADPVIVVLSASAIYHLGKYHGVEVSGGMTAEILPFREQYRCTCHCRGGHIWSFLAHHELCLTRLIRFRLAGERKILEMSREIFEQTTDPGLERVVENSPHTCP